MTENVTKVTKKFMEEIFEGVENGAVPVGQGVTPINGQSTAAGTNALKELQALPFSAERATHSSNTAYGWHALEALTGLTGVFPPTANTVIGNGVIHLTGVEGKAGGIYAGGTSNTPMIVFRKLPAGVTNPKVNQAYFVVSGSANEFSVSETHAGSPILVAGAELTTGGTEIALLTSAEDNTAIGSQAGKSLTTGGGNTLVGENAGEKLTSGEENTIAGCEALAAQVTPSNNVAFGFRAAAKNKTGTGITAIGNQAFELAEAISEVTVVGFKASQEATGSKTVAIGFQAGIKGSGNQNTIVGNNAGKSFTTGNENTLVGSVAGQSLTSGSENTYVGTGSGASGQTSKRNVAVGLETLNTATAGEKNTVVGYAAGHSATGSSNVFIGNEVGAGNTETGKLIIGNNSTLALISGVMSETAASQTIGFYGVTPVKRATTFTQGAFKKGTAAFETEAEAKKIVENIEKIITVLKNVGLME
jgi:hypothetical protein